MSQIKAPVKPSSPLTAIPTYPPAIPIYPPVIPTHPLATTNVTVSRTKPTWNNRTKRKNPIKKLNISIPSNKVSKLNNNRFSMNSVSRRFARGHWLWTTTAFRVWNEFGFVFCILIGWIWLVFFPLFLSFVALISWIRDFAKKYTNLLKCDALVYYISEVFATTIFILYYKSWFLLWLLIIIIITTVLFYVIELARK